MIGRETERTSHLFPTYSYSILLLDVMLSFSLASHVWHTKFLFGEQGSRAECATVRVARLRLATLHSATSQQCGPTSAITPSTNRKRKYCTLPSVLREGNGRLTLLESMCLFQLQMFGERQTSAAQTHKYLGRDEEEGLP